jgi:hypothetical protein
MVNIVFNVNHYTVWPQCRRLYTVTAAIAFQDQSHASFFKMLMFGGIHGILHWLNILQEWILHIKIKKKVRVNLCQKMSVFECKWKITYNNKYLNCVILYTYHIKCSKCPSPEAMHTWRPMVVDFLTLSKVLGRFRMVGDALKCVDDAPIFKWSWTR